MTPDPIHGQQYVRQMGGACHTSWRCVQISIGIQPQRGIVLQSYQKPIGGASSYFVRSIATRGHWNFTVLGAVKVGTNSQCSVDSQLEY